ncbi:hypothetical protein HNR23_003912 [Nocardiopsis mwathae]|uniref:Type VII secretion system protein EssD-like domain-containing protein n=1 Tax=Nocardiopsis mwathae TaxID=1472723 RepID=A0A7X0D6S3_9ACTN|nr:hypothetical protein [Nocardiopsis mwathae]
MATRGEDISGDLATVADALTAFAETARKLKKKLEALRSQAYQFSLDNGCTDWKSDDDLVEEHNQLKADIDSAVVAYQAAERECANKITDLYGGPEFVADNGEIIRGNKRAHGVEEIPEDAPMPWGAPAEPDLNWFQESVKADMDFLRGAWDATLGGQWEAAVSLAYASGFYTDDGWGVESFDEWKGNVVTHADETYAGYMALLGKNRVHGSGVGLGAEWRDQEGLAREAWWGVADGLTGWSQWDDAPGYTVATTGITAVGVAAGGVGLVRGASRVLTSAANIAAKWKPGGGSFTPTSDSPSPGRWKTPTPTTPSTPDFSPGAGGRTPASPPVGGHGPSTGSGRGPSTGSGHGTSGSDGGEPSPSGSQRPASPAPAQTPGSRSPAPHPQESAGSGTRREDTSDTPAPPREATATPDRATTEVQRDISRLEELVKNNGGDLDAAMRDLSRERHSELVGAGATARNSDMGPAASGGGHGGGGGLYSSSDSPGSGRASTFGAAGADSPGSGRHSNTSSGDFGSSLSPLGGTGRGQGGSGLSDASGGVGNGGRETGPATGGHRSPIPTDLTPKVGEVFDDRGKLAPNTSYRVVDEGGVDRGIFVTGHDGKVVKVQTDSISSARSPGSNIELANPRPNMTYEVDGKFTFKTDSQARTVSVSGEISLDDGIRDPGSERRSKRLGKEDFENVYRKENEQILSTAQERVGRVLTPADVAQYKDVTWNPGHLIARMFGGPGELVNLVPMTEYINRDISRVDGRKATIEDSFRVLEREWADALKGRPDADPPIPPKKVDVEIELDYSGNMNSPESITVKYVIDGTPKKRTYENVPPLT